MKFQFFSYCSMCHPGLGTVCIEW